MVRQSRECVFRVGSLFIWTSQSRQRIMVSEGFLTIPSTQLLDTVSHPLSYLSGLVVSEILGNSVPCQAATNAAEPMLFTVWDREDHLSIDSPPVLPQLRCS